MKFLDRGLWTSGLLCLSVAFLWHVQTVNAIGPSTIGGSTGSNCPGAFACGPNTCPSSVPACGVPAGAPECTCF